MANPRKIRVYIDLIKKFHRQGIISSTDILSKLLQTYLLNKKNRRTTYSAAGILFCSYAPSVFAKKMLRDLSNDPLDLNNFFMQKNLLLTSYFSKSRQKVKSEFASLWIAFLYYYHPILPKFQQKTFLREALITAHLVRKNNLNDAVEDFLLNLQSDIDESFIFKNSLKLNSVIEMGKITGVFPSSHQPLIDALAWLPVSDNKNILENEDLEVDEEEYAMRHLPLEKNDSELMVKALIKNLDSEHEYYAMNLLTKIFIPVAYLPEILAKLEKKLNIKNDLTISNVIYAIATIDWRESSAINHDLLFPKILALLVGNNYEFCLDKVGWALPRLTIPIKWRDQIYSALIDLSQHNDLKISKIGVYALTRMQPQHFKQEIFALLLNILKKYVNRGYETNIVKEYIELASHFAAEYFLPAERIALISLIDDTPVGSEIIADYLINKIKAGIEVENVLTREHALPVEMVKHVFHFV